MFYVATMNRLSRSGIQNYCSCIGLYCSCIEWCIISYQMCCLLLSQLLVVVVGFRFVCPPSMFFLLFRFWGVLSQPPVRFILIPINKSGNLTVWYIVTFEIQVRFVSYVIIIITHWLPVNYISVAQMDSNALAPKNEKVQEGAVKAFINYRFLYKNTHHDRFTIEF